MKRQALFLPGLDGGDFTANKIAGHLRGLVLTVFAYPEGADLEWDCLCALVAARMRRDGLRLLIGESFGGAVALQTALRHGDQIDALALISTFCREPERLVSALGRVSARLLPTGLLKPAARVLADWKLAGSLRGDDRAKFLQRFSELDHRELARRLALLKGLDLCPKLPGLRMPVEVIFGTRDPIGNAPDLLQAWASVPDCRVHAIAGFGHLVSAEAAPQVAAILDACPSAPSP